MGEYGQPEHRHRGGLHRDRAQGAQGHAAVPEAAGLALPLLQGPRLDQHPLRLPDLGPARHRPQPGRRLRDRDRGDGRDERLITRFDYDEDLRHRAQPLLRAGGDRPPADRLRRGRPDPRLPQHPRHARMRRAGGRRIPAERGEFRVFNQFTEQFSVSELAELVKRSGEQLGYRGRDRSTSRTRGSRRSSTTTTPTNTKLLDLGLEPHLLGEELVESMLRIDRALQGPRDRARDRAAHPLEAGRARASRRGGLGRRARVSRSSSVVTLRLAASRPSLGGRTSAPHRASSLAAESSFIRVCGRRW